MNRKFLVRVFLFSIIVSAAPVLFGCTSLKNMSIKPLEFQENKKIDLNVQLAMDPKLCSEPWLIQFSWNQEPAPLGKFFCENASSMSRALFSHVRSPEDLAANRMSGVDAILTPRLTAFTRNQPASGASDQRTTAFLEWTMKTPDGKIIWVETVKGEGKGRFIDTQEQMQMLFDDLFRRSFDTINTSKEIRRFAASKGVSGI